MRICPLRLLEADGHPGRNEMLLKESCAYAEAVFGAAAMISVLPRWLRPLAGPLIGLGAQRHLSACRTILLPFVEGRLADSRAGEGKNVSCE